MARLGISNRDIVSLFPMFNILIGILGCLIMILGSVMALSLGSERNVSIDTEVVIGGKHHKKPAYIEWNGKEVIIHPDCSSCPANLVDIAPSQHEVLEMKMAILERSLYDERQLMKEIRLFKFRTIQSQFENTSVEELLKHVMKNRDNDYIVILVRPSGYDTLLVLRDFILNHGINVGYEPIGQNWSVEIE